MICKNKKTAHLSGLFHKASLAKREAFRCGGTEHSESFLKPPAVPVVCLCNQHPASFGTPGVSRSRAFIDLWENIM
jgi:hypothetical protein